MSCELNHFMAHLAYYLLGMISTIGLLAWWNYRKDED